MQRVLLTGANGLLGGHLLHALNSSMPHATVCALGSPRSAPSPLESIDLADLAGVRECVRRFAPTHVLHVAAMTSVAACYADPARAARINVDATCALAEEAAAIGARLLFTSTDMVFAGDAAPYDEHASPAPVNVYGRSKLDAERAITPLPRMLVVRIPLLYGGPVDAARETTFTQQARSLRSGVALPLFDDEFRTPLFVEDAAAGLLALLCSACVGVMHLPGPRRVSRFDLGLALADALGADRGLLRAVSRDSITAAEPRPRDLSLATGRASNWPAGLALRSPADAMGEAASRSAIAVT